MTTKKLTDYIKQRTPTQSSNKIEQVKPVSARIRFKKETEFQDTPIGKIPKEWQVVKISNMFKLYKGTTPSTKIKDYWNGHIPFVTPSDITFAYNLNRVYIEKSEKYLTNEGLKSRGLALVPRNSLLITSRATIGYLAINKVEVAINQGVIALIPKDKGISSLFYYYLLQRLRELFENIAGGSTYKEIPMRALADVSIPLPPFPKQERIAEIISTVDFAIEKVRGLIDRAERLKKGLMQELLTKGIGHREYKETPIGKIPKEWKIVKLIDVAEIRGNKSVGKINKVAFIPMELIPDSGVFVKYEIRDLDNVSSFTYCEAGDILVAKITPSFENGKQGVVPDDVPNGFALATTEVYPIACKGVNKLFLFYVLKYPKFRKILESTMRGTTGRRRVSREALENLEIPIPPSYEQQKIAETLLSVDKYIETLRARLIRLEHVKRGLMEVLLTGKVRVVVEPS